MNQSNWVQFAGTGMAKTMQLVVLHALVRAVKGMNLNPTGKRDARKPRRKAARLLLEPLENRLVPTSLAVTDLNSLTPDDLLSQLLGQGVAVSNIQFRGVPSSAGTFTGDAGIIGFEFGILLSTGNVHNVIGPNNSAGVSQDNALAGDSDLSALTGGTTNDATVLEFDFIPTFDTIAFQYVFASEEYNEYVNSQFNDVFGFFVNGQNVALLPGTANPVSIHTVNLNQNAEYFINNDQDSGAARNTQMDGLTTVLTVVATVTPGQLNHIKLAVADVGDFSFDSNVFLKASSFVAATLPVLTGPADQQAVEGAEAIISLGEFTDTEGGPWLVTVDWGDAATSTFSATAAGLLGTLGHTYQRPGLKSATVTVTDVNNLSATATFEIDVADAILFGNGGFVVNAVEGAVSDLQVVATFSDPGGPEELTSYSATIDWGDGTTSAGIIAAASEGVFQVLGSHAYADSGVYTITTTINHGDGAPQLVLSTAGIENVKPDVVLDEVVGNNLRADGLGNVSIAENTSITAAGLFSDPGADTWTVSVNFGDGTGAQIVPFAPDKTFRLPEHTYTRLGNFIVTLTVADDELGLGVVAFVVNVLKSKEFGNLSGSAVTDLSKGGPTTVSTDMPGSKVEATVHLPDGQRIDGVTVSLANYVGNPTNDGSAPRFTDSGAHPLIPVNEGDRAGAAAPVAFYDVRATNMANIPGASLTVTFSYTIAAGAEDKVTLYFWDGKTWQKVVDGIDRNGDGIGDEPVKTTHRSEDGTMSINSDGTITRFITLTYNETLSNPRLSQLDGTVFTVAAPVPSSSPGTVATIGSPFSFVSNNGANTFASDAVQFGRTATFTSNTTTTLSLRVSQDSQSSTSRSELGLAPSAETLKEDEGEQTARTTAVVRWLLDWVQSLMLPSPLTPLPPGEGNDEKMDEMPPAPEVQKPDADCATSDRREVESRNQAVDEIFAAPLASPQGEEGDTWTADDNVAEDEFRTLLGALPLAILAGQVAAQTSVPNRNRPRRKSGQFILFADR